MNIVADPMISVPEKMMSDGVLITGVVGFMMLVFGSGFSINILDNKQREEAEQYYHHLSHHDALTGLPHQNFTMRNIEHKIQLADAGHAGMAIFMIGLSGLREIRNVHGQAASDSIFKEIASRLMALCGEGEILSRGRGDTLVAIMPVAQSKGQVHAFTERLRLGFADPVIEGGKSLVVDMLCGIALFPSDGTKDRDLLGHAELALARAEQSPNRKIVFYEPDIDENSRSRSALAIELRYAIEREELELHYQPQTDVDSGRLIGFEALLRWNHPEFGAVSPVDFIPIAEETGLILPIGEWVLKTACGAAAAWKYPYKIAVNVAPQQLATGSLPASVLAILSETGLAPSRLELEITETSIIRDHFHTLNMVRELKHLGISIAMDDFGTGYSSLSMLQSFPFDKIKIDRSFISGVAGNPQSAAIARAVIVLAQGLRIRILAEGVEDQEDLDFLQREGCHEAQGYFFGRPMPLAEIRNIANAPPEAFAGVAQTGKIFHLFPQGN
jgi:diguanylate cyclase (GGDEF)-like protein